MTRNGHPTTRAGETHEAAGCSMQDSAGNIPRAARKLERPPTTMHDAMMQPAPNAHAQTAIISGGEMHMKKMQDHATGISACTQTRLKAELEPGRKEADVIVEEARRARVWGIARGTERACGTVPRAPGGGAESRTRNSACIALEWAPSATAPCGGGGGGGGGTGHTHRNIRRNSLTSTRRAGEG